MALMVSISADGRLATKVTADGQFVLVDATTKRVIWRREVSGKCVQAVALDPSGTFVAYPSDCGTIVVEDIASGKRVTYESPASGGVHSIAIARGGYPVVFGACGRGVFAIPAAGAGLVTIKPIEPCLRLEDDAVHSLSLSRDGRLLATGWGWWNDRWNTTPDQRRRKNWEDPGSRKGVGVSIWSIPDGQLVGEISGAMNGSTAAFAGSAEMLVVSGGEFGIWDTRRGARLRNLKGPALDNPQFVSNDTLIVGLIPYSQGSDARVYVLSTTTGDVVGTGDTRSTDLMTRGRSAANAGDRFLIAHRSGQVDIYQVSPDGHEIRKLWEF